MQQISLFASPWFWGATAVVVAGAVVGGIVVASPRGPNLGTYEVP